MAAGPISSKTTIGGSSLAQAAFHHIACFAVIAGLPFILSNLFPSLHLSPLLPPCPPGTSQSGSMPLTRHCQCLPKGLHSLSDLEELGFVVCHIVLIFLFSILTYFYISCFLSLDSDSCSHLSTPLFIPLDLFTVSCTYDPPFLTPSAFPLYSPPYLDLPMDLVVYSLHVYKTTFCVSMKSSCFSPLLSVCPLS